MEQIKLINCQVYLYIFMFILLSLLIPAFCRENGGWVGVAGLSGGRGTVQPAVQLRPAGPLRQRGQYRAQRVRHPRRHCYRTRSVFQEHTDATHASEAK